MRSRSGVFRRRMLVGAVLAATIVAGSATHPWALSAAPQPPAYGTGELQGLRADEANPAAMPPGVTIPPATCSSSHSYPVVLVHGTGGTADFSWQTLGPMLADAGYCVFALNYGANSFTTDSGGHLYALDFIENSAAQLAAFIDTVVLPATGAHQVDIVGHSQGGMMPRYFIEHDWNCSSLSTNSFGESMCAPGPGTDTSGATTTCSANAQIQGAACVHLLVGLAPSNHGSDFFGAVPLFESLFGPSTWTFVEQGCGACGEQESGNPFLATLNGPNGTLEATPGVLYESMDSAFDEVVSPAPSPLTAALGEWPSSYLHGPAGQVLNIRLQDQCPTDATEHLGIAYDPVALADTMAAIESTDNSDALPLAPPAVVCPVAVAPVLSG